MYDDTKYYFRAFANNGEKIAMGEVLTFKTSKAVSYSLPSVEVYAASDITSNSAILNGKVSDDGGASITQRGFYWSSTNYSPTQNDHVEIVTGTTGTMQKLLESLEPETYYNFVAFATNSEGTAVSNVLSFKTSKMSSTNSFVDSRDGRKYQTVKIGNQTWMAENLAWLPSVSTYEDEDLVDPKYYVMNYYGSDVNSAKNKQEYKFFGVLYNLPAAVNACPADWHLPTDEEWKELERFAGVPENEIEELFSVRGLNQKAGDKLKSKESWAFFNNTGTDDFGFAALGSGRRGEYTFEALQNSAEWWTSTSAGNNWAYTRVLQTEHGGIWYRMGKSNIGMAVRCVKDVK